MNAWRFAPVLSAALLAACAAGTQPAQRPTAGDTPVVAGPTKPTTPPPTAPYTAPPQSDESAPAVARTPERTPVEPAPKLEALLGMRGDDLDELLGAAGLVRRDGPAEIRIYRSEAEGCTFHIFMYATGGTTRDSRVDHFEARDSQGRLSGDRVAACYRSLLRLAAAS